MLKVKIFFSKIISNNALLNLSVNFFKVKVTEFKNFLGIRFTVKLK